MTTRPTPSKVDKQPELVCFGRETELATLRSLLRTNAQVTIVGPPGVGKTCVANALLGVDHAPKIQTSRRRRQGEVSVELGPLNTKAALDLFVATFTRSRPERPLSEEELALARTLVDHPSVDRLPLAIEIVASRAALLGVKTLLLGDVAAQGVQDSMRPALEESYLALASSEEREALERLAVFRGTFDLEGARAMNVSAELLAALRESSLIRTTFTPVRFALHGSVRDFAFAKLRGRGTAAEDALDRRDALLLEQNEGRGVLDAADLRAIAERGKDPLLGLRALLELAPNVIAAGGASGLIPLFGKLLASVNEKDKTDAIVGNAFAASARLQRRVGHVKEAEADEDAALAIAAAIGDFAIEGRVLGERAFVRAGSSPVEQTKALFDRAVEAQKKANDQAGLALTLLRRAGWQRDNGALNDARTDAEAAFALASAVGHRAHVVHALVELSLTLVELDDDDALKMLDKTKLAAHEAGEKFVEGYAELGAGMFLHARGALDTAAARYRNALTIVKEVPRTAECIRGYLSVIALEKSKDASDELQAKSDLRRTSTILREAGEPRYAVLFDAYAGASSPTTEKVEAMKKDLSDDGIAQAIRVLTTRSHDNHESLGEIAKKTSSDLRIALRVARAEPTSKDDAVVIGDDGSWLKVGAETFDLSKHRAHGAILVRLANAHIEARGQPVAAAELIAIAWPNERIGEAAAQNRLRVALAALRKYPVLKEGIVTSRQGGGYFLDPVVSVRLSARLMRG